MSSRESSAGAASSGNTAPPSATTNDLSQPIFTKSALLEIEEQIENETRQPYEHPIVKFQGEWHHDQAKSNGTLSEFSCVTSTINGHYMPAHRGAEDANAVWQYYDIQFERAPELQYLLDMVRSRPGTIGGVDKIFGFGLGPVCAGIDRFPDQHVYEHMHIMYIAGEISKINGRPVTTYAADPGYTPECIRALGVMGIQVIDCFGAKGFTMVDDSSIVVTRYPSFPIREILADLCRPVALIGNRQKTPEEAAAHEQEGFAQGEQEPPADRDTARTRKMLEEYDAQAIEQSFFEGHVWYWRN